MLLRSRKSALSVLLALVATAALLTGAAENGADARPAPAGQDPIRPGTHYRGDFPDPAVLKVGRRFFAYSTTSDGLNVPVLTSGDLHHWKAVRSTRATPRGDALPRTARWSAGTEKRDGRFRASTWAPTVTRLGKHRFVLAYATKVRGTKSRMCISLAFARRPRGPFRDTSTRPTICPRRGAIDPQVFVAPTGRKWLLWKVDHFPARLYASKLRPKARHVVPGSTRLLATVKQHWEGSIIENPAMIRYQGRYYLFYSGNSYATGRYAIGYMICKTWYGGCHRVKQGPLMGSTARRAGPGGATPFVDKVGRLRIAYHAWRSHAIGYADSVKCRKTKRGCGQRRLYIARLGVLENGHLTVREWA